ncbi:MAG: hypothetical protein JWO97_2167 [Acidobacteria bacterium]|nr:hypothetical protein [Acidobacteriota bacterium]
MKLSLRVFLHSLILIAISLSAGAQVVPASKVTGTLGDVVLDGSVNSSAGVFLKSRLNGTFGNIILQTGATSNSGSFVIFNSDTVSPEIFRVSGTGNIGSRTSQPWAQLSVETGSVAAVAIGQASGGATDRHLLLGYDVGNNYGSIQAKQEGSTPRPLHLQKDGGSIGIGLLGATPIGTIHSVGPQGSQLRLDVSGKTGTLGAMVYDVNNVALLFDLDFNGGWTTRAPSAAMLYKLNNRFSLDGYVGPAGPISIYREYFGIDLPTGAMSIGQASNNANLTVYGNITATGSVTSTYQDVAEWVPSTGELAPGTVVVVNPSRENEVMSSHRSYDTGVAGVVSAQPGIILGVSSPGKAQVATTGRVKVRVDATKHPVHVGDLLVTGERSGTAMVSQPIQVGGVSMHRPGTLIGKALQPLESGEGEVLVLLSLQ